jgi:hypothetical protein
MVSPAPKICINDVLLRWSYPAAIRFLKNCLLDRSNCAALVDRHLNRYKLKEVWIAGA